ncbi:MAG: hypothetical protein DRJ57_06310 [Thermoprotei archaeon]|nr:MAG: hypothetical protein DRJ57_06310 [Thermoprotei archaeon]
MGLVILSTLLLYNVYRELGFEDKLRGALRGGEREALKVIFAVYLSGFMEYVSGYGVRVAVSASSGPTSSAARSGVLTATLVGHSWAVLFAALGVPTAALSGLTGRSQPLLFKLTGLAMALPLLAIVLGVSRTLGVKPRASVLVPALALPIASASSSPLLGLFASIASLTLSLAVASRGEVVAVVSGLSPYIAVALVLLALEFLGFSNLLYEANVEEIAFTLLLPLIGALGDLRDGQPHSLEHNTRSPGRLLRGSYPPRFLPFLALQNVEGV